jgi:hypothetical protein
MSVRVAGRSFILVVLAVLLPGISHGDDSNDQTRDVRCLLAAVAMMNSPNNTIRAAAATSALYYLGRVDGREPHLDLEKLLAQQSQQISPTDLVAESKRCGQELSTRARILSTIGQRLPK